MAIFNTRRAMWRGGSASCQSRHAFRGEHGFQFRRWTGHQQHQLAMFADDGVNPLAGRGAVGVGQDVCAVDQVGLLGIVGGHGDATFGKSLVEGCQQIAVAADAHAQGFCDSFTRQIILGGTEATHDADDICATEGEVDGLHQVRLTIADDGFKDDADAERIQLLGDEQRIRVLTEGGQQF